MSFPEQITLGQNGKPNGYAPDAARDSALKNAGLLTVKESTVVHPGNMFTPREEEHVLQYDIAPGHEVDSKPNENDPKHPLLCYAKVKIESVDNYSEPADMLGHTISEVDFTYTLKHFAPWTGNKDVQDSMPIKTNLDGTPQKSKTMLLLTHNGWQPDPSTHL